HTLRRGASARRDLRAELDAGRHTTPHQRGGGLPPDGRRAAHAQHRVERLHADGRVRVHEREAQGRRQGRRRQRVPEHHKRSRLHRLHAALTFSRNKNFLPRTSAPRCLPFVMPPEIQFEEAQSCPETSELYRSPFLALPLSFQSQSLTPPSRKTR